MNMDSNFKEKLVKGVIICLSTAAGMALSAFIGTKDDDIPEETIEGTCTDVTPEETSEPTVE